MKTKEWLWEKHIKVVKWVCLSPVLDPIKNLLRESVLSINIPVLENMREDAEEWAKIPMCENLVKNFRKRLSFAIANEGFYIILSLILRFCDV